VMEETSALNAGDWSEGDCSSEAPAWYRWGEEGEGGLVGCFTHMDGQVGLAWQDDNSAAMSVATGESFDDFDDIAYWWENFPTIIL